ncbi:response regulator transcription factor [Nocardia sp. CC227C]|uniref:response regulator transcription factor n=1 Tax=Nocardia sp. CC227C TaxID=3044562 RepID=UPI00278BD582|nr:response regulator transcription factor [Nocardia sp. CC227C]
MQRTRGSGLETRICPNISVVTGMRWSSQARRTLVIASEFPFVHDDFERAAASVGNPALAGRSSCRDVVEQALHSRADIVLLDASVEVPPGLPALVRRLRALDDPPLIALLVARGVPRSATEHPDVLLAADFGPPAVLHALKLVASGVMVAAAPPHRTPLTPAIVDPDARRRLSTLTEREREILLLIVDGLSNREVGARLFISPDTVKDHVSRILTKLGVTSRIEAAVVAVRANLCRTTGLEATGTRGRVRGVRPVRPMPSRT